MSEVRVLLVKQLLSVRATPPANLAACRNVQRPPTPPPSPPLPARRMSWVGRKPPSAPGPRRVGSFLLPRETRSRSPSARPDWSQAANRAKPAIRPLTTPPTRQAGRKPRIRPLPPQSHTSWVGRRLHANHVPDPNPCSLVKGPPNCSILSRQVPSHRSRAKSGPHRAECGRSRCAVFGRNPRGKTQHAVLLCCSPAWVGCEVHHGSGARKRGAPMEAMSQGNTRLGTPGVSGVSGFR